MSPEEAFEKVHKLVYKRMHQFHRRYGGEISQLKSDAHFLFMEALNNWVPERGALTTYVSACVYKGLKGVLREKIKQQNRAIVAPDLTFVTDSVHKVFVEQELMDLLSPDARLVAELALHSRPEIRLSLFQRGGETIRNIKDSIREYLQDLGWSSKRIKSSFSEIANSLPSI